MTSHGGDSEPTKGLIKLILYSPVGNRIIRVKDVVKAISACQCEVLMEGLVLPPHHKEDANGRSQSKEVGDGEFQPWIGCIHILEVLPPGICRTHTLCPWLYSCKLHSRFLIGQEIKANDPPK